MSSKVTTPTPFGKFTRTLRIHRDEYMKDMAKKLDVAPSYLSAVETGRRNVPHSWGELVTEVYGLNHEEQSEIKQAIWDSRSYEVLNVAHLSFEDRRVMRGVCELLPVLPLDDERRRQLNDWIKGVQKATDETR